jgi:hypothetical protein
VNPIFTLPWTEFAIAQLLTNHFTKKAGYSLLVPISREEKGIDLVLLKKGANRNDHKVATIQVKASRTYTGQPPKRSSTKRYKYHTWFNKFDVSEFADFYVLVGHYVETPAHGSSKTQKTEWYKDCSLVFTNAEMQNFISSLKTRAGKPEGKFGFGFDSKNEIIQTRGDQHRTEKNFTTFLLEHRWKLIAQHLA